MVQSWDAGTRVQRMAGTVGFWTIGGDRMLFVSTQKNCEDQSAAFHAEQHSLS